MAIGKLKEIKKRASNWFGVIYLQFSKFECVDF